MGDVPYILYLQWLCSHSLILLYIHLICCSIFLSLSEMCWSTEKFRKLLLEMTTRRDMSVIFINAPWKLACPTITLNYTESPPDLPHYVNNRESTDDLKKVLHRFKTFRRGGGSIHQVIDVRCFVCALHLQILPTSNLQSSAKRLNYHFHDLKGIR